MRSTSWADGLHRTRRRGAVLCLLAVVLLMLTPPAAALERGDDTVVGTVESLQKATNEPGCTTSEMELCDTIADAVRAACGTDIAVVNGGDVVRNLDGGEAAWGELKALFAVDRTLAVTQLTGAELLALLEHGVSHAAVDLSSETLDIAASSFAGFPQISGFTFTYDPTAPIGMRVVSAELAGGGLITGDMVLTMAAAEYMLAGGYGYPAFDYVRTDLTLAEALVRHFEEGVLARPEMGRITCIGLSDRFAVSRPALLLIAIAAILISVSVRGVLGKGFRGERDEFR